LYQRDNTWPVSKGEDLAPLKAGVAVSAKVGVFKYQIELIKFGPSFLHSPSIRLWAEKSQSSLSRASSRLTPSCQSHPHTKYSSSAHFWEIPIGFETIRYHATESELRDTSTCSCLRICTKSGESGFFRSGAGERRVLYQSTNSVCAYLSSCAYGPNCRRNVVGDQVHRTGDEGSWNGMERDQVLCLYKGG